MKKYVNTDLYAEGSKANSEGYECLDVSTNAGKRRFVKKYGIGTVIEPKPKKFRRIPKSNKKLNQLIWDIVKFYNEHGYLMFFSDSKDMKKSLINQMKDSRIILKAEWLEENDPEMLDWITSNKYWGRGYEEKPNRSKAVVELYFDEGGVEYKATFEDHPNGVKQSLNNQGPWGEDSWEDWTTENIKKYYELIK